MGEGPGSLRTKYLLLCRCIYDSLSFDMQHTRVLIKLSFDLLTLTTGSGVGEVCRQNICGQVAAFVISFNFICKMKLL